MKAKPSSLPAPVGGWNTRDDFTALPAGDAIVLDNFFPDVGAVKLRDGYTQHQAMTDASGNNIDVDTLAEYHSGATRKLIAAADGEVWDATSTPSSLASGFSSNTWQTVMFKGRLFMANGADAERDFDGTTLNTTAWTGATAGSLIDVEAHKGRLYFVETSSMSFWYAGAGSVSGTLTEFDLSSIARHGGHLLTAKTWTLDGGAGPDDYIAFITDKGEVIVYQGDDPSTAANWSLVGNYKIGVPLNRRAVVKTDGDLLIATTADYVYMSKVLRTGQLGHGTKLSGAIQDQAGNKSLSGWGITLHNKKNMVVSNIPQADGTYDQHVLNALTGAACRFKGLDARCWTVYNDELYFGSTGSINQYTGDDDNGSDIEAEARGAWVDSGFRQRVSAVRPVFTYTGEIDYGFSVDYDYSAKNLEYNYTLEVVGAAWDVATWDVSSWGGTASSVAWRVSSGTGQAVSVAFIARAQASVSWHRTDLRVEGGKNL